MTFDFSAFKLPEGADYTKKPKAGTSKDATPEEKVSARRQSIATKIQDHLDALAKGEVESGGRKMTDFTKREGGIIVHISGGPNGRLDLPNPAGGVSDEITILAEHEVGYFTLLKQFVESGGLDERFNADIEAARTKTRKPRRTTLTKAMKAMLHDEGLTDGDIKRLTDEEIKAWIATKWNKTGAHLAG